MGGGTFNEWGYSKSRERGNGDRVYYTSRLHSVSVISRTRLLGKAKNRQLALESSGIRDVWFHPCLVVKDRSLIIGDCVHSVMLSISTSTVIMSRWRIQWNDTILYTIPKKKNKHDPSSQ